MPAEHDWIAWMKSLTEPRPALREFARQYHYFSLHQIVSFSRALSSIPPTARQALSRIADVLIDELGPVGKDDAHSLLFERFAISIGVDASGLPATGSRVHSDVRAYVRALDAAFSSGSLPNVFGAYLFLERSAVDTYPLLVDLIDSLELGSAVDTTFFAVHTKVEPKHLDAAQDLIDSFKFNSRELAEMDWQIQRLATRWEAFWKGIHDQCRTSTATTTMPLRDWRTEPAFGRLSDIVASDRLLCLTGAGVSSVLERATGDRRLPSWPQLLRELRTVLSPHLPDQDARAVDDILDEVWPSGRLLIQAAEILRCAHSDVFDKVLEAAVTPKPGATSETHLAIEDLLPRGVFTFNYDTAHENAATKRAASYQILVPDDEHATDIVGALSGGLKDRFLLKAHGTLGSPAERLVLTATSYREIMARQPAYRALVQHLLTEFHLLILGFGMSDPDFDLLIDTLVDSYGSHIRDSVLLRHRREEGAAAVGLARRYGIHTLYIDDYSTIPDILRDASANPGPLLQSAIDEALTPGSTEARSIAHSKLRELGPAGRLCASRVLNGRLERALADTDGSPQSDFQISEILYSIGVISERMRTPPEAQQLEFNRKALLDIVGKSHRVVPIARALTVLRPLLSTAHLGQIAAWCDRFSKDPFDTDAAARLKVYAEYLEVYIPAKFNSEPG